jgi:hypothetical protein
MNIRHFHALPLTIIACGTCFAASPAPSAGALAPGNSAIVGLWHLDVVIGPCDDPPNTHEFLALQNFNLGGTVSGSDTHPSSGQGSTSGLWSYDRRTHLYTVRQQFARFVNNVYDGLQDIHINDMALSPDGEDLAGDVDAFMLNTDGSVRVELCGAVTGERVHVDD